MSLAITELYYYRGRVGLYAILKALGIGAGDQVAIQAFTCLAVSEAVLASGTSPVYIDVSPHGYNIEKSDLSNKLTPHTRAIIVQHTFGIPVDMDRINKVAEENDLPIIEDCCHTLTSKYKGENVGSFGVGSFYSYEWGKPVVAGIGGSVRINDKKLLEKIRSDFKHYHSPNLIPKFKIELQYRAFRLLYRPSLYWPVRSLFHWLGSTGLAESNYNPVGQVANDFSLRMSPHVKTRLLHKLNDLEKIEKHSRWATQQYRERINSDVVEHPVLPADSDTVFVRYPLLARNKSKLLNKARRSRVELAEWYATPIHPLTGPDLKKVKYTFGSCPNAERRCRQVVTLPVHPGVRQKDIDRAVDFLNGMKD